MNPTDKIFLNGFVSVDVPDTAPEFILGKGFINCNQMIDFLMEARNQSYCKDGKINFTILRSKATGKRYATVDTYQKPQNATQQTAPASPLTNTPSVIPSGYEGSLEDTARAFREGEVDPSAVPF